MQEDNKGQQLGLRPPICGDKVTLDQQSAMGQAEILAFWCATHGEALREKLGEDDDVFRLDSGDCYPWAELRNLVRSSEGKGPLERLGPHNISDLRDCVAAKIMDFLRRPVAYVDGSTMTVWDIMAAFHERGYDIWVAGGAVRDFLGGANTASDVDLAGTVPPGRFVQIARELLRPFDLDIGRHSPGGVIYVYDPGTLRQCTQRRVLEYAPLKYDYSGGEEAHFEFDHDAKRDAEYRDLTINSLYADVFRGLVIDPTGKGRQDLPSLIIRVVEPVPMNCPEGSLASRVFRLLKFMRRWRHANIEPARCFIRTHLREWEMDFEQLSRARAHRLVAQSFYGARELGDMMDLSDACGELGIGDTFERLFRPLWVTP